MAKSIVPKGREQEIRLLIDHILRLAKAKPTLPAHIDGGVIGITEASIGEETIEDNLDVLDGGVF